MRTNQSRREFLKMVSTLAASGALAWPFAPYFVYSKARPIVPKLRWIEGESDICLHCEVQTKHDPFWTDGGEWRGDL